jgi:hypothetical protein
MRSWRLFSEKPVVERGVLERDSDHAERGLEGIQLHGAVGSTAGSGPERHQAERLSSRGEGRQELDPFTPGERDRGGMEPLRKLPGAQDPAFLAECMERAGSDGGSQRIRHPPAHAVRSEKNGTPLGSIGQEPERRA